MIDAREECPEEHDERQNTIEGLQRLSQGATTLRLLATSRDVTDVHHVMDTLDTDSLPIAASLEDDDIKTWLSVQLSRSERLRQLDAATKVLSEETISQKAGGMRGFHLNAIAKSRRGRSSRRSAIQGLRRSASAMSTEMQKGGGDSAEIRSGCQRPF